jgi:hypothetical protein
MRALREVINMGWTKEQFIKFCGKAGVKPENAMREGKIDMRSPEIKAKHHADRVKGANELNKVRKKREAKERKHAISDIVTGLQNAQRKSDSSMALEQEIRGQNQGMDTSSPRYRIKITGLRVRPIDEDNFCAGCKNLIDGIVASGLVPGDDWKTTAIECAQLRVKTWDDECTLIEIDIPDSP